MRTFPRPPPSSAPRVISYYRNLFMHTTIPSFPSWHPPLRGSSAPRHTSFRSAPDKRLLSDPLPRRLAAPPPRRPAPGPVPAPLS